MLHVVDDASKNGAVVGAVYKDVKGPLFPTIAVHSQNEEYVVPSVPPLLTYYYFTSANLQLIVLL